MLPPRFRGVVNLVIGSGLWQGGVRPGARRARLPAGSGRRRASAARVRVPGAAVRRPGEVRGVGADRTTPQGTLDVLTAHLAAFPARDVEISDRTDPRNPKTRTARLVLTTSAGGPVTARSGDCALRHCYASLLIRHTGWTSRRCSGDWETPRRRSRWTSTATCGRTRTTGRATWSRSRSRLLRTRCGQPGRDRSVSGGKEHTGCGSSTTVSSSRTA